MQLHSLNVPENFGAGRTPLCILVTEGGDSALCSAYFIILVFYVYCDIFRGAHGTFVHAVLQFKQG